MSGNAALALDAQCAAHARQQSGVVGKGRYLHLMWP
jgi:hypothetical protein